MSHTCGFPGKGVAANVPCWKGSFHRYSRPTKGDLTAMLLLSPSLTSRHRTNTRSLTVRVRLWDRPPGTCHEPDFLLACCSDQVSKKATSLSQRRKTSQCLPHRSITVSRKVRSDGIHLYLAVDMQLRPETPQDREQQYVLTLTRLLSDFRASDDGLVTMVSGLCPVFALEIFQARPHCTEGSSNMQSPPAQEFIHGQAFGTQIVADPSGHRPFPQNPLN